MIVEKTGKILHLDGDRRYSQKARKYYKKAKLDAIVINVSEKRQPIIIIDLLKKYNPDILVITGHDKLIRQNRDFYNIYNYRNSRYFVETVIRARTYKPSKDELIIFAGACQSYFEALIKAGANFASSPARIKIDFMDPIVVAEKIARTPSNRYIILADIIPYIRDGSKGVGGTIGKGKKVCNISVT